MAATSSSIGGEFEFGKPLPPIWRWQILKPESLRIRPSPVESWDALRKLARATLNEHRTGTAEEYKHKTALDNTR